MKTAKKIWVAAAIAMAILALGVSGAMATYMEVEVNSSWVITPASGPLRRGPHLNPSVQ